MTGAVFLIIKIENDGANSKGGTAEVKEVQILAVIVAAEDH